MVSPTNAMLAKGADSIIILAPIADGLGMMPGAFDDAKLLSEHSHVLVISPDSKSRANWNNIYNPNNILKLAILVMSKESYLYNVFIWNFASGLNDLKILRLRAVL